MDFFTGGITIMDYGLLFWTPMDLYCKYMQLVTSQDVNCWNHVDFLWIIVMFLSAVWTLILTAPIHCRIHLWASDVVLNVTKFAKCASFNLVSLPEILLLNSYFKKKKICWNYMAEQAHHKNKIWFNGAEIRKKLCRPPLRFVTTTIVSASDIMPTERWLNVWCIWHT